MTVSKCISWIYRAYKFHENFFHPQPPPRCFAPSGSLTSRWSSGRSATSWWWWTWTRGTWIRSPACRLNLKSELKNLSEIWLCSPRRTLCLPTRSAASTASRSTPHAHFWQLEPGIVMMLQCTGTVTVTYCRYPYHLLNLWINQLQGGSKNVPIECCWSHGTQASSPVVGKTCAC